MICTYCKMARAENTAPCTNCGAPSLLQEMPQNAQWGNNASTQWEFSSPQQRSGNEAMLNRRGQQPPPQQQWQQPQQGNAFLPIPYQESMGLQQVPQVNIMQGMLDPAQDITITPPNYDEGVVYVLPMYTKPRPIIPRYRIISGFLSVIIVTLMLCGGASYYAKASGKLDMVSRVLTGNNPAPPSIRPSASTLPDPPNKIDIGTAAAYKIIPSATTTSRLINGTTVAAQTDKIFKPNETFYLTYSVYPPTKGKVVIEWYMNNLTMPYRTVSGGPLPAGQGVTGMAPMVYAEPAEGKVSLYWNDQLAQSLYFVVRN